MFDAIVSILNYTILTFTIALSLFYLYSKHAQTYWSKRGVYSPPCHWFFGHFKDAFLSKKSFPKAFGDLHNSIDVDIPVVGVYVMQKPFLLIRSPEMMKQIFVKDFNIFCNRYFAAKRKTDIIGCQNLFSINNPEWKYIRSKLSPAFSGGKLKKLFQLMIQSTENLTNHLNSQVAVDDKMVTIDCRQLCDRYTTDVISTFSFGVQTNSFVQPELYQQSRKVFDLSLLRTTQLLSTFFFPKLSDYLNGSMLGSANNYFRKVFWESMGEREKSSGTTKGDIIDFLKDLKNEEQSPEFRFEGDYLVAQSAILLVAGVETSAITMSFTLMELAKNPEIQKKARAEIEENLRECGFTYESMLKMTYLSQVTAETLRLYPPAPIIDRVATQDYKISGTDIIIEKGTPVYVALNGIHEDPHYHPDPLKYDPDRFSEERKHEMQPFTYLPFGEGPRICIGMRIGQLQTLIGLVTILKDYEVSLNPQYETVISKRSMFLSPVDGVRLYFKKVQK